jgi:uncharacterized protein YcbX
MLGEQLSTLDIDTRGAVGDRTFALRTSSGKIASGKTTRRFERTEGLFQIEAWYSGVTPVVRLPTGSVVRGDDPAIDELLSAALGQPVSLTLEAAVSHLDAGSIHLLTTASLRWLQTRLPSARIDERRFRPNLVLDVSQEGLVEDQWLGRRLRLGDQVILSITERTERCVMPNLPQGDLPDDPSVLRSLADSNASCLGVYASVLSPGTVRLGYPAYIIS